MNFCVSPVCKLTSVWFALQGLEGVGPSSKLLIYPLLDRHPVKIPASAVFPTSIAIANAADTNISFNIPSSILAEISQIATPTG